MIENPVQYGEKFSPPCLIVTSMKMDSNLARKVFWQAFVDKIQYSSSMLKHAELKPFLIESTLNLEQF